MAATTSFKASHFTPSYLKAYEEGWLRERVEQGLAKLNDCTACPRNCHINRLKDEKAVCRTGRYAIIGSIFPHFGEEDCLRGRNGSGTIFFSWCNLRCVFCQNFDISQQGQGVVADKHFLARAMLELQNMGCHNINFVTPEHVVPQVLEAVYEAVKLGLCIPLVYNTSGYDSLDSIKLLEGIVDIYMPDFKCIKKETAKKYLKAPDYPERAREAIAEMHRQVGDLVIGEDGLAKRGVLVRHLVMPAQVEESREIFRFLASLSREMYVNIMAQYYPAGLVSGSKYAEINRHCTREEIELAYCYAREAGLHRFDFRKSLLR